MTARAKVGVVIHYSEDNYGNHLVNYATRRLLEERGYEVALLIPDETERIRLLGRLLRLPRKLRRLGPVLATRRIRGRLVRAYGVRKPIAASQVTVTARRRRFTEFAQEYLRPRTFGLAVRNDLAETYDWIAIGSDQIWNFDYGVTGTMFADFARPGRAITLAPSVGHDIVPAEWVPAYRRWLSRFREVGTREIEWAEHLIPYAGAPKFTLLVDPTLMFDRDVWDEIATPIPEAAEKILVYHLGPLLRVQEDYVSRLAAYIGLEELRLSEVVGGALWETNAAAFLGMVRASACVVTDSYHGAIFAFLYNKPVVLLERHGFADAMNTRLRVLTERLHLEGRMLSDLPVEEVFDVDYRVGTVALEGYRSELRGYLERLGMVALPTTIVEGE